MTTRDRIEEAVKALLAEISTVIDDEDVTEPARMDLADLWSRIDCALDRFNLKLGPDPFADGGPTQADVKGEVRHDIG